MRSNWKAGDWAVYRKSKQGTTPGRRAARIVASSKGENYGYVVDKFWIVDDINPDGMLRLLTATGKIHLIKQDDPNLRRPSLLQRFLYRERFSKVSSTRNQRQTSEGRPAQKTQSAVA